ncbi:transposase [Hamadaea sp. NPDC050747]|uniref:transposase n=1 Tax=Hamadaea sp. NPDC050747 TaxID=3155789 RepID=UPI0033FC1F46
MRAAETVAKSSRGYDAGKKVNGRKRHIVVDTTGLLLIIMVTTGAVQDRDAARALRTCFIQVTKMGRRRIRRSARRLGHRSPRIGLEIVRKLADQVVPRRSVVERTLS